LVLVSR